MPGKQRNNNRKKKRGVSRIPPFFRPGPLVQFADLAYSASPGITESVLGAGGIYVFNLSSIYDPDFSTAGTTALGYTAYSSFFTRYRVVQARIELTATSHETKIGPWMAGYMLGPNTTTTSAASLWPVQTNSYAKLLNATTPGGDNGMLRVNRVIDLHKVQGVTKQQFMTDLDYSASFGTNPARSTYLILWVRGLGASACIGQWDVRIVYHTELSQPYQAVTN